MNRLSDENTLHSSPWMYVSIYSSTVCMMYVSILLLLTLKLTRWPPGGRTGGDGAGPAVHVHRGRAGRRLGSGEDGHCVGTALPAPHADGDREGHVPRDRVAARVREVQGVHLLQRRRGQRSVGARVKKLFFPQKWALN